MSRGNQTKRRSSRSSRSDRPNRPNRAATVGVFTGTALAAALAALPVHVTVSLSPEPHTVVVGQPDTPNPVCPAASRLPRT